MSIERIAVVGAGTMGQGIAQTAAESGYAVLVTDVQADALTRAEAAIDKRLARAVDKGQLEPAEHQAVLGRIETTTAIARCAEADLVIEAATEDPGLKTSIFEQLGRHCGSEAILASNTSSISLTAIAAAVDAPARVIGMHFFNPVPVMNLVELIRALQTSDATFETARDVVTRLGKTPVSVQDSPGFVVNRMLVPMINEAAFALSEGLASAEEIDVAMRLGANHPMGPLALADLIGLDVCLYVMDVLHREFSDSKYRACPLLRKMVAAGYLGRKSGRGFFVY